MSHRKCSIKCISEMLLFAECCDLWNYTGKGKLTKQGYSFDQQNEGMITPSCTYLSHINQLTYCSLIDVYVKGGSVEYRFCILR